MNKAKPQASPTPPRLSLLKKGLYCLIALLLIVALAQLGSIHGKDIPEAYFSNGYPSILGLLNSELFMGFIFLVTLGIGAYVAHLLWQLHEVAVHRAEDTSSPQLQLIFALSLCGLFIDKTWWVLAIILAFTSWDIIGQSLTNIIRQGTQKGAK